MYKMLNSFTDPTECSNPEYLDLKKRFKKEHPKEYIETFGMDRNDLKFSNFSIFNKPSQFQIMMFVLSSFFLGLLVLFSLVELMGIIEL